MKNSELEDHRNAYYEHISNAKAALKQKAFHQAMRFAACSWEHIDGTIQYERKKESKESFNLEGIDLVLHYAPLIFDAESLDNLESRLKGQKRIAKHADINFEHGLAKARAVMWDAHRLWNQIELRREVRQDKLRTEFGGDQDQWRALAEAWQEIGLIVRVPADSSYRLSFTTDMSEATTARCPTCGAVAKAPKAKFLEKRHCPKCGAAVSFVLLGRHR
ncbi:MAG TPA: hypothetical protein VFG04_30700 [Planctomycetaceae bacterium]|jgi:hypothetical protein|nr:hypothetical protein [Planctomycetaceae bacterium]